MNQDVIIKSSIIVSPDLWETSLMPEGILEHWLAADGSHVDAGDAIAKIRVEDAVHDLIAPVSGRLQVAASINSVVEPGAVIGEIIRGTLGQDFFEDEK